MDDYLWKIFDYNNLILKYYVIKCNRLQRIIYIYFMIKKVFIKLFRMNNVVQVIRVVYDCVFNVEVI